MAFPEFTDEELELEIDRLIKLYPSVEMPVPQEITDDLNRIWHLQLESFARWRKRTGQDGLLSLYSPLYISRCVDAKDLLINGTYPRKIRRPEDQGS
jgi:hypothetical protein